MFIYNRNVSVSLVVAIIRKRNNDALTNNIYSFFLKYIHINTDKQIDRQTHTHTFAFIYKITNTNVKAYNDIHFHVQI
jgi:hypothetical protein